MNSDIPSIGNEKALLVTFLLLVGDSEPDRRNSVSVKSLVPYRQCSARRNLLFPMLLARSTVDTAICAKPLGRWMYGDWMPLAGK
jgi:hypothetical protein